jgi:hypothetical protein
LVVKIIDEVRAETPALRLEEVDITGHPEVAVKYRVMVTPALAINGELEFVGVPREEALRARLRAAADERPD